MKRLNITAHAHALALAAILLAVAPVPAPAQTATWPARPVRLVVGFAAGGPTDIVARGFADQATRGLGQPVVVDNKPGANTIIAAEAVASATDGHTLLMAATNHTMIPALYSARVKFDAVKSFTPVCMLAAAPTVLVVGPSLGVKTLGEFLQKARAKPLSVTYATPGMGSSVHFASELFAQLAAVKLTHIPYKGAAPAVADVMAGQVDASFATLGSVLPQIRTGKLTALALATPKRSTQLPDVPTFEEAGVKGYAADAWYGLLAPAGTPEAVTKVLEREARAYATSSAGAEKLRALGMEPAPLCGEAFATQVARETATWSRIAKELNLKVD
jgi:tripartite-type tricarboxylate transporter receptor subunit TctC